MGVPVNYNLRNLIQRKGTTLMTALGIGLTVAVLVISVALTAGLNSVFAGSGDARQFLALRTGVDAELTSTVSDEAYQVIRRLPGIAKGKDGEPMVSPEGLTVVNLPSVEAPEGMNVTVRGMLPIGTEMRDVELLQGKMFTPGLREVAVGESIAKRYPAARIGQEIRFGRGMWKVVGVFRVGESAANSEIWTDLNQLRGDFERAGGSSSLLVRVDVPREAAEQQATAADAQTAAAKKSDPKADVVYPAFMKELQQTIAKDQRLNVDLLTEKNYYARQTQSGVPLQALGFFVAVVMAVGSGFAATNTMYAAVARRSREIATMRALGFGRFAILRSFVLESVCLALIGGLFGVLIALPVNGLSTGVGNFQTFSETAFKFHVGPSAILVGLLFAAVIGAIGGLLPAWAAARTGIVQAMREG
jgi:putative ABC transport system permease protein